MKKRIIANWKSQKTSEHCRKWLDTFSQMYQPDGDVEIIIAPSMVSLEAVNEHMKKLGLKNMAVAAQDVSPYPLGSYTGAVAADLLKPFAKYVIIGHSERRRYFHETLQDVANKLSEAADSGIVPILCVEKSETLFRLISLVDVAWESVIIAYTPVDELNFAIGEPPERVSKTVLELMGRLPKSSYVYGGAVHRDNAASYIGIQALSGLFVGSESLEVASFAHICRQV
jgi:triosephosphate isomerase